MGYAVFLFRRNYPKILTQKEIIMKKTSNILWGIVLIAVGVLFALNAADITNINIFFDGWWTLLIIVPCAIGLFTDQDKTGSILGIAIGVVLLLCCRDVLSFAMIWKLLLPTIIIIIGLRLVFAGVFEKADRYDAVKLLKNRGRPLRTACAVFSGCDVKYDNEVFEGANFSAIFGGVDCDLRNAIIEHDCVIQAAAVFGGIDIIVPAHVNVQFSVINIFGETVNKSGPHKEGPTIYITGLCMFGGIEVK